MLILSSLVTSLTTSDFINFKVTGIDKTYTIDRTKINSYDLQKTLIEQIDVDRGAVYLKMYSHECFDASFTEDNKFIFIFSKAGKLCKYRKISNYELPRIKQISTYLK
jgi:hypothetical protein